MSDQRPLEPSMHDVLDLTIDDRRARPQGGADRSHPAGDNVVLLLPDETGITSERPMVVRLEEALDATNEMILVVEPSGRVLFANRPARQQLGLDDVAAVFRPVEVLLSGARREEVWAAIDVDNEWRGELSATRADGSTVHIATTLLADRTTTGDVRSLTVVAHDIGEQRALEDALEHRSTHDGLTGLSNRQHLLQQLDALLPELAERDVNGALLLIDVDEFRTVTNSLGHEAGDRILVAFAHRLLRTFPASALLARVGGDEFAVFCQGDPDPEALAQQVHDTTTAPFYIDGNEVHLSVVTGITPCRPSLCTDNAETLLREADAATFRAKEKGRGGHAVFEPSLQTDADDRLALVQQLRRALRNDELRVNYQPKVDIATGEISGVEALMRWETPDGEVISPGAFMQVAEDTGLIIPMGRWVLEEVCEAIGRLAPTLTGRRRQVEFSVNLSVRQLAQPEFVDELEQILRDSGVDPRIIELEITESVLMDDVEHTTALLEQLKGLGVRIAVDDFGTGYSSLKYLQRLPVDVLKVDQSFVAGLMDDDDGRAIVTAVIHLAQALRLQSVAEGVETGEQLEALRELGCDQAQGYHIARPMSEEALTELLAKVVPAI